MNLSLLTRPVSCTLLPVHEFMWKNCEGFVFGRTDWEYVNNAFVYPVNVGSGVS
jgi:hypothetical protein